MHGPTNWERLMSGQKWTKPWYESKTVWTNIVASVAAVASMAAGDGLLPPIVIKWMLVAVGVGNVWLRSVTDTAISR